MQKKETNDWKLTFTGEKYSSLVRAKPRRRPRLGRICCRLEAYAADEFTLLQQDGEQYDGTSYCPRLQMPAEMQIFGTFDQQLSCFSVACCISFARFQELPDYSDVRVSTQGPRDIKKCIFRWEFCEMSWARSLSECGTAGVIVTIKMNIFPRMNTHFRPLRLPSMQITYTFFFVFVFFF